MREFASVHALRGWVRARRSEGRQLGFVPTMGALHEGHLRLADESRRRADVTLMSIFVNPLQFGAGEDLARYPRPIEHDRSLASARGVDALFLPEVAEMYPPGAATRVVPGTAADRWEGAARPGHFAGVLTVVAKLFHIVQPDVACFGQKDWQQATLVRQMVRDLDFPIEVVVVPTVREADGLALSSRNAYLDEAARAAAAAIPAALRAVVARYRAGEDGADALAAAARAVLEVHPGVGAEYIAVVDPLTLEPVARAGDDTVVAIAARVGSTRLIDNVILGQGIG
jgi:pantoate--beta-alanine ligase